MSQRKAVTKKLAISYKNGSKSEKSAILDQVVGLTGWHRDYARRALKNALVLKIEKPRYNKPPIYGTSVIQALVLVWEVMRFPAGKRLAPMLKRLVPLLRKDGHLNIDDATAKLLCQMSAASIDRHLKQERKARCFHGRSHTKPGTLLKSQIPVRTYSEWNEDKPGFVEIDLVGHTGGNSSGEFCFTLTMTDIYTGWTINRSVKNKAAVWVFEAIEQAKEQFPFKILGIDSDNGSEFINHHLFEYCKDNKITFTRSRSGKKNDGCYVEQKNWTHVRELVGYLRFDTEKELELLNKIFKLDQNFTNYFSAQQKLISKERIGSKVVKRHDTASSPFERASKTRKIASTTKTQMKKLAKELSPGKLSNEITDLLKQLEKLALSKAPARIKPKVNRSFNQSPKTDLLHEAMN